MVLEPTYFCCWTFSPSLTDLAIQAQTLSSLASNPVLSSLQQIGLEGIMGQPNFAQFAAAASSVLSNTSPFANLGIATTPTSLGASRSKHTRIPSAQSASHSTSSITHSSSSAKRTRLDGINSNANQSSHSALNQLPAGARGQNLVSLVSPSDNSLKSSHGRPITSPSGTGSSTDHHRNQNHSNATTTSAQNRPITSSVGTRPCKVESSVNVREGVNATSKRCVDTPEKLSSGTCSSTNRIVLKDANASVPGTFLTIIKLSYSDLYINKKRFCNRIQVVYTDCGGL